MGDGTVWGAIGAIVLGSVVIVARRSQVRDANRDVDPKNKLVLSLAAQERVAVLVGACMILVGISALLTLI
jgi:hypothetical protein